MTHSKLCLIALLIFLLGLSYALSTQSRTELEQIQEEYWQNQLEESPYLKLKLGLAIDRLPDLSYEKAKADANFANSLLERLKKIDASSLNHDEWISLQILTWDNAKLAEGVKYFWLSTPVTPYASPLPTVHRIFTEHPFNKDSDLDHYLALLRQYPTMVRTMQNHLEQQFKQNLVLPQEEVELVIRFVRSFANKAETSLFSVNGDRLKALNPDQTMDFHQKVNSVIDTEIFLAIKSLDDFLSGDYRLKAPKIVGVSQYPNGKEYYRYLVRLYTTMDVAPEEIHQLGLRETEKLDQEMESIRKKIGFKGSKAEFHQSLKRDPRFFPKTPEQIGEKLMSFIDRIEPKIGQFFVKTPKALYGVRRLDPTLEGSMTFGYYQEPTKTEPKGLYFYNGSNLKQRSLLHAGSLIYHELVPGHHFQLTLQSENTKLPDFRRNGGSTAYVEGWAEYSSSLANEMGMYEDPYDQYGRLAMDMFLTSRLVVDTGMNYLGWPRSRAMEFMRDHLLISDTEINTETLRYSCDIPGQALAYKMGSKKILDLRRKMKEALKNHFDIRDFHDLVLASGSMPMSVLEQHLNWFIQNKQKTTN